MKFDDPEQNAPFWVATNNVVLNTPFPGIQIKAAAIVGDTQVEVFVSGLRCSNCHDDSEIFKARQKFPIK
jgi:hypothetical protein